MSLLENQVQKKVNKSLFKNWFHEIKITILLRIKLKKENPTSKIRTQGLGWSEKASKKPKVLMNLL
jgi:hypothetical protein